MKTRELADLLANETDVDVIEARLFIWFEDMCSKQFDRETERMRALVTGKFWLPCGLRGDWMGGHEWLSSRASMNLTQHTSRGVCSHCEADAQRLNERWPEGLKVGVAVQ